MFRKMQEAGNLRDSTKRDFVTGSRKDSPGRPCWTGLPPEAILRGAVEDPSPYPRNGLSRAGECSTCKRTGDDNQKCFPVAPFEACMDTVCAFRLCRLSTA